MAPLPQLSLEFQFQN